MLASAYLFISLSVCLVAVEGSHGSLMNDQNHASLKNVQIIGGKNTTIEEHPYQVSITFSDHSFLAGSILNEYWIVTPAGGLTMSSNRQLFVRVGSNRTKSGGKRYKVQKTILHPDFNSYNLYYDVALHKLKKPLTFGTTVKSINLPTEPLTFGKKVVVSGWGATSASMNTNGSSFKEIILTTIGRSNCSYEYSNRLGYTISTSQKCAITSSYYRNGPFYDHGAPLVSKNTLYGQYSFRYVAAGVPCVFSDIYELASWIKTKIGS